MRIEVIDPRILDLDTR